MSGEETNQVLQEWRASAPYWETHRETIEKIFAPITRAIIEEAEIAEGETVLDIAGGVGEPSLTIAEIVGPRGCVTCTDGVAEMVAAAEREANRRGITGIKFRQCLADALPYASDTFDATVCRLGIMFFPDPIAALIEMLRVTKQGGRVSLAVWSSREINPFFYVIAEVLSRYIESPPEEPNAPGAFRFAEAGALAGLLKQAGASEVRERAVDFSIGPFVSVQQYWTMRSQMSDTLRGKLAALSQADALKVAQESQEAARKFLSDDYVSFPAQVMIVTGKKTT